jgi:RNA polymerase sigma factor (sigma-70 family)
MVNGDHQPQDVGGKGSVFATTHWSVVLAAGQSESPQAGEALDKLCRVYWYPLYVYARRRGNSPEDAQDLTQAFFVRLLAHDGLRLADPARGRFRTFLLNALQNFLVDAWRREQRVKHGGHNPVISLDAAEAERRYVAEPSGSLTPDRAYDRRWALTVIEQVLCTLRQEYSEAGKGALFDALRALLWGADPEFGYAQIGAGLGLSETAVKQAVHRLRERYRDRLRAEVAQTLADPKDLDEELRYLVSVVSHTP